MRNFFFKTYIFFILSIYPFKTVYSEIFIIAEINQEVIPKSSYKTITINKNDKIEILELIGGG